MRSGASFYLVIKQFQRQLNYTREKDSLKNCAPLIMNYNPYVSSRYDSGMCLTSVCNALKCNKFHPFHVLLDRPSRWLFWKPTAIMTIYASTDIREPEFLLSSTASDELPFKNHGTINRHNLHYWAIKKLHCLHQEKSVPASLVCKVLVKNELPT